MLQHRRKHAVKSVAQRADSLPWELPVPLEPMSFTQNFSVALFQQNAQGSSRDYSAPIQLNNESNQPPRPPRNSQVSSSVPSVALTDIKSETKTSETTSTNTKTLPPIGVFWDIENCSVPKGRSALVAVQRIRERFFVGHIEAEFLCVCDIRKEAPTVIQELNDAQVSVVHVSGNSKNAADDKLRQAMRRFADISCSNPVNSEWLHPATIILISGDINFVADLSDLRYRKRLYIVLLHNKQTPEALLMCSHEHVEFHSLLMDLPFRQGYFSDTTNLAIPLKGGLSTADILLSELPLSNNIRTQNFVRNRLRKLSENCGGRVISIRGQWAVIRFPNYEAALRASKRMNGEDVLGNKIRVVRRQQLDFVGYQNQALHIQEDIFNDSIMQCSSKSNYGVFGSTTTWRPTWKRPVESTKPGFSRNQSIGEEFRFPLTNAEHGQSNSSSTGTSRDESPTLQAQTSLPGPHQLHNSGHCHPQSAMNSTFHNSTVVTNSHLPFRQSAFPGGNRMMTATNMGRQDGHQSQNMSFAFQRGESSTSGPRLYSLAGTSKENSVPRSQSSEYYHGFGAQKGRYNKKPLGSSAVGNGINAGHHTAQTLPFASNIETTYGDNAAAASSSGSNESQNGSYSKSRQDGESFDLTVTNIDPGIGDWKAIRAALSSAFGEHVNVKGIWVSMSHDGTAMATVKLINKEEAHFAVAQLHRRKIGTKRIFISFDQGMSVDYATLKKEVVSLLQDVPNHTLPLFKFREMFEKRYKRSVASSDLYRLRDVAIITESNPAQGNGSSSGSSTPPSGRNISLAPGWHTKDEKGLNMHCKYHPPKAWRSIEKSRMGWAEKEAEVMLPNVIIEIKTLGTRVHTMLQSHDIGFPLISFLDCHDAEFGPMEIATEGRGVPLEHLLTSLQGVEIIVGDNGMKWVQWQEKKDGEQGTAHQPLATQLSQFGRELVDLLKTFPKCTVPFSKLIPHYHAHFGRQCRVADYGHFSLLALLQSLPHIVQIMGAAQNRLLTLSHRAQMKRFATDMLRVLKSQGGPKKQIRMDEFPSAFFNVFTQRQFQPEDYGLCFFSDLVSELVETSALVALVKDEDGQYWLAVPKREQTAHEIHKTRIFAGEVTELLRHSTRCELEFSKFVPYYHHHFQRQCRVSEYGFGKLVELFDAISDTVTIISNSGSEAGIIEDKIIRLTPKEQIKVVGEQICSIVGKRRQAGLSTTLDVLVECFLDEHGFYLRPELCGADSLTDLISNKLRTFVRMNDKEITTVDRVHIEELSQKAELILQQMDDYTMDMDEFICALGEQFKRLHVDEGTVEKDLCQVVSIGANDTEAARTVSLSPIRVFAHEMTLLLESNNGSIPLPSLENQYFEKFGQPLRPAQLGYPTVLPMLQAIADVVSVIGKHRTKRIVVLNSVKASLDISSDDNSSSNYGRYTPRANDHWKGNEARQLSHSAGSISRPGKYAGNIQRRRRSAPPIPIFSPLASPPTFTSQHNEVYSYEGGPPMTPPMYADMWLPEPGSPPVSPPVVWTCHPIFYPSSPTTTAPGNILMPPPYLTQQHWSPPPMNSSCFDAIQPTQPPTLMGNEFLFGQTPRLAASFEKLAVSVADEVEQ